MSVSVRIEAIEKPAPTGAVAAEPVHVRVRAERGSEVPDLLLWADRLWAVHRVIGRHIMESDLPGVLAEHVWWVEVRAGRSGPSRVCELRQSYPSGHWRLYAVVDEAPVDPRPESDRDVASDREGASDRGRASDRDGAAAGRGA